MIATHRLLHLPDLTPNARSWMELEWRAEQANGQPYRSPRMTPAGIAAYLDAMPAALRAGNEHSLVRALAVRDYWKPIEWQNRRGRAGLRALPSNAHVAFAVTEFLTFYVRGMARTLLEEGEAECVIYRAAPSWQPRRECRRLEGIVVRTQEIYEGHRARYWPVARPHALSVPVGANCHHSITRIRS